MRGTSLVGSCGGPRLKSHPTAPQTRSAGFATSRLRGLLNILRWAIFEVTKSAKPGVGEIVDNRDICMNERMLERLSDSRVKFFHDRIQ